MKRIVSLFLCVMLLFAALPLCTAQAAEVQVEQVHAAQGISGDPQVEAASIVPPVFGLISEAYAHIFGYAPENMEQVIADLIGMVYIMAFGEILLVPMLLLATLLRTAVGAIKVLLGRRTVDAFLRADVPLTA